MIRAGGLPDSHSVAGLAGLAVAVTALIATLEAATAGTGKGMAIPSLSTPAGLRDALASTGFALIAAAVLGTVITAGEFRHKTATGTYLDQPGRGRVLAAAGAGAGSLIRHQAGAIIAVFAWALRSSSSSVPPPPRQRPTCRTPRPR